MSKIRASNCYKVDEDKLREAYARYGYVWIIEEGWDDPHKAPELDEVDFYVED